MLPTTEGLPKILHLAADDHPYGPDVLIGRSYGVGRYDLGLPVSWLAANCQSERRACFVQLFFNLHEWIICIMRDSFSVGNLISMDTVSIMKPRKSITVAGPRTQVGGQDIEVGIHQYVKITAR